MITVIAVQPEFVNFVPQFFGAAVISSRVITGRAYLFVRSNQRDPLLLRDPIDNTTLIETCSFDTQNAAELWIAADVATRRNQ